MIIAVGIDLVELDRFQRALENGGTRLRDRLFTAGEQELAPRGRREVEFLAGRFAAKEAVFKCLGTGWGQGVSWHDAEVLSHPSRAPRLFLHGAARLAALDLGIRTWVLSITHTERTAGAVAVADGP